MGTFKIVKRRYENDLSQDVIVYDSDMIVSFVTSIIMASGHPVDKNIIIELDKSDKSGMVKIIVHWKALDTNLMNRVKCILRGKTLKKVAAEMFDASKLL